MAKGLMRWEPFRGLRRWDPWSELRDMQYEMEKLFERFGMGRDIISPEARFGTWLPAVESYVKGKDLVFKCELPGVDPNEVDVTVDESAHELIIKGERKTEKDTREEDYIQKEMTYGTFERRFTLPEGVKADQVKARFTNGILEVSLPAAEITAKAKKIEIETPKAIEGEAEKKKAA